MLTRTKLASFVAACMAAIPTPAVTSWDAKGAPSRAAGPIVAGSPNWTAEGDQAYGRLGFAVSTAGDVNGDGYDDVIVSAPYYDNGEADEGVVRVYHGSPSGLVSPAAFSVEGNQAEAEYGYAAARAGDVNGDGYDDVIVGARSYDNGEQDEGAVWVYHGSPQGLIVPAAFMAEGNLAEARFGWVAETAGDVNGDGYDDVIVGAGHYTNGQVYEGRIFVYHGSASGVTSPAAFVAESNQEAAYFGQAAGAAGDVNGDGYDDVIVGARSYDNGQRDEGRVWVYHGSPFGLSLPAAAMAEGNQEHGGFGTAVATAGDVNGDGYDDVIVGAPGYENSQGGQGQVWVFHGSASGLIWPAASIGHVNQDGSHYGHAVARAGDVNGDGYGDVIVGAPGYDTGQPDAGRVWLHHGSASGLVSPAAFVQESNQYEAAFGNAVATAGDVNGDGYDDVIVGALYYDHGQPNEGAVAVYHGPR